ncbi:MAG: hypothetical protein ABIK44_07875, partial [candidate division WOR-3 bacterium]
IETFDLLTPKFSGGLENYWGKNPFKLHSEYLGILPLLFALIALLRSWRKPQVKFFFSTFLVVLIMAWGGNTPFYRIPYHLLPGIAKFRGPGMIFFLAAFSLSVLAGYGINYLLTEPKEKKKTDGLRGLIFAGGVLLLLLLFALVGRDAVAGLVNPGRRLAEFEANYPRLTSGLLFAVAIWAVGYLIALWAVRGRISSILFGSTALVLMVLDIGISLNLWNESKGYIRSVPPPKEYFAQDDVVRFLSRDTSRYRVLPLNYARSDEGLLWLHGIQSTGGQIPNPLQSYQDFIGAGQSVMFQAGNLLNPNFMNLLNVKYVIAPTLPEDASRYDEQSRQFIAQLRAYFSQPWFEPAHVGPQYTVYRNKGFLPRAFITPFYEVVKDKDAVISRLMKPDFDPSRTALLYENPGFTVTGDTTAGTVELLSYDANCIRVRANLTAPGILVLGENWHPDWRVLVDGKPAPLLRAYHTLRAVALEPGNHEVTFNHKSGWFRLGLIITGAAIGLLVFVAALTMLLIRIRRIQPAGEVTQC